MTTHPQGTPPVSLASQPVIPGFHPDPSICRAGDDYFLVTSSFEYFPAVPVFHSRDLTTWTQIGNVLERESQFQPGQPASRGIFAPTLRYHDGRFWMITTDVSNFDRGHLLVTASDPAGPWSDPVHLTDALGIDPDIAWDDDGTCHVTWCSNDPEVPGIVQARVDPVAGRMLETPRRLWSGTGLAYPEAPHLYRTDEGWLLVIAEGGTERGHCVSVARGEHITGPFTGAPGNPIFTRRSTTSPVQNTGHADLVRRADGEWAAVYLGVRPRGSTPGFHVNGRETFLAGIDWAGGWPHFDVERYRADASVTSSTSFTDTFTGPVLDPRWVSPDAVPSSFTSFAEEGGVRLAPPGPAQDPAPAALAVRARDPWWQAQATIHLGTGAGVRMAVRMDGSHWYAVEVEDGQARARLRIGPVESVLGSEPVPDRTASGEGEVGLRIRTVEAREGGPDDVELSIVTADGARVLASADGRYLSTEVTGGFTGRVIALQALAGEVVVRRFDYRAEPAGSHERQ